MAGNLFVVSTPIGNLGDLTHRAAKILDEVDFIAAEDTRVTARLLNHLDIKKEQISYYRHNMDDRGRNILDRIEAGENCALCCDAGTPAVSDPGQLLVRQAADRGINVIPVPGPCAAIAALSVSGFDSGRFCFEGFLPMSKKNRMQRLDTLRDEERTMVFYEAPHKLRRTLDDLCRAMGPARGIVLARELTKSYEEVMRTTLDRAREVYAQREPRGEYVLIVEGADPEPQPAQPDEKKLLEAVLDLTQGGLSLREACRQVAQTHDVRPNELYQLATEQKKCQDKASERGI